MPARVDLTGQKYARLTVLEMIYGGPRSLARCKCDCGKEADIPAHAVKSGNTKSCGCLSAEKSAENGRKYAHVSAAVNRTHGMSGTPTYLSYYSAKHRCVRPKDSHYHLYGGRGIRMCDRWLESFANFLADMGECPPGLTIERLDNEKGYEPGNCVWATHEQQAQNRRWCKASPDSVRAIRARAAAGEKISVLASEYGMSHQVAYLIVKRKTWKNIE